MKKRTKLLVASMGACALLVGGTFAAWVVTDNADPFKVKVSPGTISTDDVQYVTLSWGDKKSSADVGGLAIGEKRLAAVVELKADKAVQGTFAIDFKQDQYTTNGVNLYDHLDINVYEHKATDVLLPGSVVKDTDLGTEVQMTSTDANTAGNKKLSKDDVAVTESVTHVYDVVVSLDAEVTSAIYGQITSQLVELTFDWGFTENAQQEIAKSRKLYVQRGNKEHVYMYAFKGSKVNKEWPGLELTGENGLYSAEVKLEYEYVIFTDGTNQTKDIKIADISKDTDLLTISGEGTTLEPTYSKYSAEPVEKQYYIVGKNFTVGEKEIKDWNTENGLKVTFNDKGYFTFVAEVAGPDAAEMKMLETTNNEWIGMSVSETGNYTLGAGKYNVYVKATTAEIKDGELTIPENYYFYCEPIA